MNTEAEQQLLHHARNGNTEEVRQLLETIERNEVIADINCKGELSLDFSVFSWESTLFYHILNTVLSDLACDKSFILGRTPTKLGEMCSPSSLSQIHS